MWRVICKQAICRWVSEESVNMAFCGLFEYHIQPNTVDFCLSKQQQMGECSGTSAWKYIYMIIWNMNSKDCHILNLCAGEQTPYGAVTHLLRETLLTLKTPCNQSTSSVSIIRCCIFSLVLIIVILISSTPYPDDPPICTQHDQYIFKKTKTKVFRNLMEHIYIIKPQLWSKNHH